jgi:hypothetical protein
MPSDAQSEPETEHAARQGLGASSAVPAPFADEAISSASAGLSNDYLNHYSEALMLIEMAADDPAIGAELADWNPISYRGYFEASELRRASAALLAYEALPEERRLAFEKLVASMDSLATMAVFALQSPYDLQTARVFVETTAPPLRGLIARAGAFLNSGGQELVADGKAEEAQIVIDRLLEQAAQRAEA